MSNPKCQVAVGLNAKRPEAGKVKTRLCPPLSPPGAAELYQAMLLDLIDRLAALDRTDLVIFCDPPGAAGWFQSQVSSRWQVVPQRRGDLGRRLDAEAEWMVGQGYAAFALLGSDAPTMSLDAIRQALTDIREGRRDVVFGPDHAGGYYMIALGNHYPGLFSDVAWGGPGSLGDTESNAKRMGLRVGRAEACSDVDTGGDLIRLNCEVRARGLAGELPRTSRWLQENPFGRHPDEPRG